MDKIYMHQLQFYGYHGVFSEEKTLGQRYMVDLTLSVDLHGAGVTDDLSKTVNYADVYQLVKQIVEGKAFDLIEAVAETIANSILSEFVLIKECTVKVTKPNPPIPGHYESVAVEISRTR
ncbi:dihydroneopterin aldolase [Bacillus sp. FJAT-45350]|uniref:dihydroneopterin aldolase n=1 Tax=Bacillus sp. FJAT-45350 TaxID=2011014 RepID=UPI000BB911DA|nr:dihydroneopterin aldolase [Bacillus sp. FJAT-45350]